MIHHCKLVAAPLISRVSRRPKCSKPYPAVDSRFMLSLSSGFCPVTFESCLSQISHHRLGFLQETLRPRNFSIRVREGPLESRISLARARSSMNGAHMKTLARSGIRVSARALHQRSLGGDEKARAGGKALPWILGRRDTQVKKKDVIGADGSSWEESAENYFSKNGGKISSNDNPEEKGEVFVKEEKREFFVKKDTELVEDMGMDPINDPRWDRIKSKYNAFANREPRFERPDVHRWSKQENWGRKTWKEATESSVPKMVGQGVYGVGPILAALTVARREFYVLYVQEGMDLSGNNRKKKDKRGVEKVLRIAEKIGLKVVEASKHDLNMVVDNRPHQGLVLDASPLEMVHVKGLEPASVEGRKAPLWVALDEVTDPQNLGAIIRSAYFFGAEGVIMCSKNSAPLSGVVSKASAGSLELIELRSCKNMMQFLSSSIENGWRVLGGSISNRALPLSDVETGLPTVLVLGSEGSGLRPLVERSCTELIRIPGGIHMNGDVGGTEVEDVDLEPSYHGQELKSFLAVESLNVSVAAGVLLYHLAGKNSHLMDEKPSTVLEYTL